MFDKSFVRNLSDTIISDRPLSYDQLYFLVDIVADYMYDYDPACYNDLHLARLSLSEYVNEYFDYEERR